MWWDCRKMNENLFLTLIQDMVTKYFQIEGIYSSREFKIFNFFQVNKI